MAHNVEVDNERYPPGGGKIARTWDGFAFGGDDTGRYGGWIQTFTERQFWPLDPRLEDIDIVDIAHHLSMQCRFSGATSRHYSVAEHSVRVAQLLREAGCDFQTVLWGLVHDAPEAYLVDLPRPLKQSPEFAEYAAIEARVMRCVCRYASLPYEQPEAVELADRRLLATERRDLLGPNCKWKVPNTAPLRGGALVVTPMQEPPKYWKGMYLAWYRALSDQMEVEQGA